MIKLVYFNTSVEIMDAFTVKYASHVINPSLIRLDRIHGKEEECNVINFIEVVKDNYQENAHTIEIPLTIPDKMTILDMIYCVNKFSDDDVTIITELEKHFDVFQVWENASDVDTHKKGVWIYSPCEVDYLFNHVVGWVFA